MSHWTQEELLQCLSEEFGAHNVAALDDAERAYQVVLPESGDLEVTLIAGEEQIYCSTPLVTARQVGDRAAFNEACMRLNPINPLSNLGLSTVDGEDVYVVFGELSGDSTRAQVIYEIRMLAINALDAIETLQPYLVNE